MCIARGSELEPCAFSSSASRAHSLIDFFDLAAADRTAVSSLEVSFVLMFCVRLSRSRRAICWARKSSPCPFVMIGILNLPAA
jgi:hypothetical protein